MSEDYFFLGKLPFPAWRIYAHDYTKNSCHAFLGSERTQPYSKNEPAEFFLIDMRDKRIRLKPQRFLLLHQPVGCPRVPLIRFNDY